MNMTKLAMSLLFFPLSAFAVSTPSDATRTEDFDRVVIAACKDFTAAQMADPNSPCYQDIKAGIDERQTTGVAFDANITPADPLSECAGCQVMSAIWLGGNTQTDPGPYEKPAIQDAATAPAPVVNEGNGGVDSTGP